MATDDSTNQPTFWGTGEPVKRCPRCRKMKPLTDFRLQKRSGKAIGRIRTGYCGPCRDAMNREWRESNPEHVRQNWRRSLLKTYKITLEDYERMFQEQKGVCAICREPETGLNPQGKVRNLSVDHDHATGKARQLLCNDCNRMLGIARDNPAILRAAADYLERHAANSS